MKLSRLSLIINLFTMNSLILFSQ